MKETDHVIAAHVLTTSRKEEHLDLCAKTDVESELSAGWEKIELPHCALPEVSFNQIDLSCSFLGRKLNAPFFISSMTGGSPKGEEVNLTLAKFCEEHNIAMGVGSQRVSLENNNPSLFNLRAVAPTAFLFANIGIVQFNYGLSIDDCKQLIDRLNANALILHANVLQEAIQNEGDRNFANLFKKIGELKKQLKVPIILKETGCGLDQNTCVRAIEAGVDVLDIAGAGGTHWGFIEGLRHPQRKELGTLFRNWGIPSARAFLEAKKVLPATYPVIASGGIRSGLDVARALYCGADLVGMALPFLKAALEGPKALNEFYALHCEAIKIALLCTGCENITQLKELGKHLHEH